MNDADRRRVVPRVVDGHLWGDVSHGGVQIDDAVFGELHQGHGEERLADRPDPKMGVDGDRCSRVAVGIAHATGPLHSVGADQGDAGAGDACVLQHACGRCLELLNRLGCGIDVGGRYRLRNHRCRAKNREDPGEPAHGKSVS